MAMRVPVGIVVLTLSAAVLVGCSSEETAGTTPTPAPSTLTPTPTPSIDVEAVWAGGVCTAIDDLTAAVGDIAASLTIDPLASQGVLEQLELQLAEQIAELDDETAALGAALGSAPIDYVEASATITELQSSLEQTQAAGVLVLGYIDSAAKADTPIAAAVEVGQGIVAAKVAFDAVTKTIQLLTETRSDTAEALGPAFDRAPECQQ